MKNFIFIVFIAILAGCKSSVQKDNNYHNILNRNTVIYKFMYLQDYGIQINEQSFWSAGKGEGEFAIRPTPYIGKDHLIESIVLMNKKQDFVGDLTFAFVFENKDTIYASENLSNWIIKNNGVSEIYQIQEKDSVFINELLEVEPFLRSCK